MRDLQIWVSSPEGAGASKSQIREKLNEISKEYVKVLNGSLVWDANTRTLSGYNFESPATITPTLKNAAGKPVKSYLALDPSQLAEITNDPNNYGTATFNFQESLFLSKTELTNARNAIQQGNPIPASIRAKAQALDINPITLLKMQAQAYNLQDELSFDPPAQLPPAQPASSGGGAGPQNIEQGVSYMQNVLGFPRKGAEYLAANIMQESSWNGSRTWDIGHIDGTDRNGGLISWQDTASSNHFRLRNIERYLGKSISQATHAEQLQAMKWEMQNNPRFSEAYRIFMNPNSTDRDLRRASYQYWGWGDEGINRFGSYLARARSSPSFRNRSAAIASGPVGPTGALTYEGNRQAYRDVGNAFQNLGFRVGEQSDFDPVDGRHASNSYHNYNEAFDITHQTGDRPASIAKTRRLKEIVRSLGLFREVIGPGDGDPNHESHLHLGGLIRPITQADIDAMNSVN